MVAVPINSQRPELVPTGHRQELHPRPGSEPRIPPLCALKDVPCTQEQNPQGRERHLQDGLNITSAVEISSP